MDKPIPSNHQQFIDLVAAGENYKKAAKLSSIKKKLSDSSAEAIGSKLAKKYSNEIESAKQERQQLIKDSRKQEVLTEARAKIISQDEVDAKLCEVISSKYSLVQDPTTKRTIKVDNTTADRLKAIDIYYNRFGSYAADKLEIVNKKIKVIISDR